MAQRIAWTCDWQVLFHESTVEQQRNNHNILADFRDEIPGYINNSMIMEKLCNLELKQGTEQIPQNMLRCYEELCRNELVGKDEMILLSAWLSDLRRYT